jgi:starch synthase
LLKDPELAKRMGEAGRKRVEAIFSWTAIAEQTVGLYRGLIEGRK